MPAADPLSALVDAHLALEQAGAVRSWRVHLAAVLSVPVAVAALWPQLLSQLAHRAVLTAWGLSAAGALWAVVVELRLARVVSHRRARRGSAV